MQLPKLLWRQLALASVVFQIKLGRLLRSFFDHLLEQLICGVLVPRNQSIFEFRGFNCLRLLRQSLHRFVLTERSECLLALTPLGCSSNFCGVRLANLIYQHARHCLVNLARLVDLIVCSKLVPEKQRDVKRLFAQDLVTNFGKALAACLPKHIPCLQVLPLDGHNLANQFFAPIYLVASQTNLVFEKNTSLSRIQFC